jgi:hypothetical protein
MKLKKAQKNKSVLKWIFAGALLILVGAMIVIITNMFLQTSTSSSTRAAKQLSGRNSKYDAYCKKTFESNFKDKYPSLGQYALAYTYQTSCGSLNHKIFNLGGLLSTGGLTGSTEPGICCIALSYLYVANDKWCTNQMPSGHWSDGTTVAHIPAVCKDKANCTGSYGTINTKEYTTSTSKKCDYVAEGTLSYKKDANYCCMMPLPTNTP